MNTFIINALSKGGRSVLYGAIIFALGGFSGWSLKSHFIELDRIKAENTAASEAKELQEEIDKLKKKQKDKNDEFKRNLDIYKQRRVAEKDPCNTIDPFLLDGFKWLREHDRG